LKRDISDASVDESSSIMDFRIGDRWQSVRWVHREEILAVAGLGSLHHGRVEGERSYGQDLPGNLEITAAFSWVDGKAPPFFWY
jgi:hypothetical protein